MFLRPYKGMRQRVPVTLKLPADLPEGEYTATVCDDLTNARQELRDNPHLSIPQIGRRRCSRRSRLQTSAKRTNLVVRVPVSAAGVALQGKSLPNLPPSMVHILGKRRKTGAQTISGALVVARSRPTGSCRAPISVRFTRDARTRSATSR